jgi:hypothetical protein
LKKLSKSATSEGGRFFHMMERQSQTFEGRLSTLRDKMEIFASKVGQGINEMLSPYLDKAIDIIDTLIDKTGKLSRDADKQKDVFAHLYNSIRPSIDRYEQLRQKAALTKKEQAESLRLMEKIGKTIPIAASLGSEGNVRGIDTNSARDYINMQEKLFTTQNETARAANVSKLNDLKLIKNEYKSIIDIVQDPAVKKNLEWGTQAPKLKEMQQKFLQDNRSLFDKYVLGEKKASDELSAAFKDSVMKGDWNEVSRIAAEKLLAITEEQLQLETKLAKLRGDKVTAYMPSEADKAANIGLDPEMAKLKEGVNKITGGGKQSVNVTINISELIGIANLEVTKLQDGVRDMERVVIESLLRTVNSANYAAQQ